MDKLSNTTFIALLISGVNTLIAAFLFYLYPYWGDVQVHWPTYSLITLLYFLCSFILIRITLENYIYEKIKVIYKSIHQLKVTDKKTSKGVWSFFKSNTIHQVNQEVVEWVKSKKEELEALHKTESYRREFVGNVSHELKTPIFNIQGYISTLLDGGLEDAAINRAYLVRAEKSINRMIAIVEDLEIISRLEYGEIKLLIESFDIVALTKDIIEHFEVKSKEQEVKVVFNRPYTEPIYVNADKERIRQALSNLIDNAIKYNNKHGKTVISFDDMDRNVLIQVKDSGIGIDQVFLSRIFERFYRVDKSRSRDQGGSGLGLSIVKHVIEAHQQTIHVSSEAGVGTTFSFSLPKTYNT